MSKVLTDDEVLHRNIHPSWIVDGVPTSQAFTPTAKDDCRLSLDRSLVDTPEQSYQRHKFEKNLSSEAVFGVTVAEFDGHGIRCMPDPIEASDVDVENPAHCIADYSPFNQKKSKKIARKLVKLAVARGQLHP